VYAVAADILDAVSPVLAPVGHRYARLAAPVGELLLVVDEERRLCGVYLPDHRRGPVIGADWRRDETALGDVRDQLLAYFAGELRRFALPLAPTGTPFQRAVWWALGEVPFGETVSYGALARRVGRPGAARAVGLANARNPISVVVPCHRVVGASGALTGYAGGVGVKARLLAHEAEVAKRAPVVAGARTAA
jgi:methylated-DNA-[protein]-cysteine S-methyltransferase